MKTRRAINRAIISFAVISGLLLVAPFVAALGLTVAGASGGPVRPSPVCDDSPKTGVVELRPNGTMSAIEQVTFTTPFCTDNLAAFASVDNGNTGGEATGAKPWGVTAVNVSMRLDAPSSDVYRVYWRVEPVSQ